ncbi:hypothetical protein N8D56_12730 [Devosia sp. A8/3-2]|nr:hypothetical protein N8D56_12730 [Devosia sp. A8/3-2]
MAAAPIDLISAHDFSDFFNAYLHRVFPKSGLPMQDYGSGGVLFLDGNSDAGIADMIAAIHTMNFPVLDTARLAGVLTRLKSITALSRQNWDAILAETDDNRELVPSPTQTSLVPEAPVTQKRSMPGWQRSTPSMRCSTASCWCPIGASSRALISRPILKPPRGPISSC